MRLAVICFTETPVRSLLIKLPADLSVPVGRLSAFARINMPGSTGLKPSGELRTWCKEQWKKSDCILFIGAAGIAVRAIAPYVADKTRDPAVIVTGQGGKICHISFIGTYRRGQRFCRRDCGDYRRAGGNNYCHGHCREICRGRICPEKRAFNLLYGAGKRGVGCRAQGGESRIFF